MSVSSRKDSKGYVLRVGECQRNDGRYSYSYTDRMGVRHSIYSKSLVTLREREKKLQREYEDGLDPHKAARLPMSVRAAEISAEGSSLYVYDPKGKAAFAYAALIKEVMNNG